MFYYLLAVVTGLALVASIIAFILYKRGVRFNKTTEQRETEEGLQKAFGKNTRWGLFGGADNEIHGHSSHSHHSDSGSGYDGGGHDGGSSGGD